ncbi:MAG: FAD-dependent oxidoreductase, partial [Hyphomicrobiales bacterium]
MTDLKASDDTVFDTNAQVVVIGAGACGLTAALAAHDAGAEVLVLERDKTPAGSTALSSGFIPAANTRLQMEQGITDTPEKFANDIQLKAKGKAVPELVSLAAEHVGPALEWLSRSHGLEWVVLDDFLYPGHSTHRMHAVPERTGVGLMARLQNAAESAGVPIATECHVTSLIEHEGRIIGVEVLRPDGVERIACKALVLACNGYGGNPKMVAQYIPEMKGALYFGHTGNTGDAVLWGEHLGAQVKHLSGYQGHGSVAHPYGVLITWALMMEGGIQVNTEGMRFSNEHGGYSEQAVHVLAQPDGIAWNIYDERLHYLGMEFEDYRTAFELGAVIEAATPEELARKCALPLSQLSSTLAESSTLAKSNQIDKFGRQFAGSKMLAAPFYAVRVTGALFHTQGGLMINDHARVMNEQGEVFVNLFAGGGAACGVSGPDVSGYL